MISDSTEHGRYKGRGDVAPHEFRMPYGDREAGRFYQLRLTRRATAEEALATWPFMRAVYEALGASGPTTARQLAKTNGWLIRATEGALDSLVLDLGLVTAGAVSDARHGGAGAKLWWRVDSGQAGDELAKARASAWYAARDARAATRRAVARGGAR